MEDLTCSLVKIQITKSSGEESIIVGLGGRMGASSENMAAKVKKEVKKASEMPKLAPQLDGLNCFETLICHLSAWFLWLISSSAACRGGC
ncbi:hypothetical protein POTOM_049990 [Populus tomentosa]|uniref:Uncharacterized protein n=1 Tax=Populus tomentosa TaxID=118781 RepID=A0A8X7YAZ9_POPTO|nr:hypothetical protein POTOM_049990 [Populus tomentosa]